MPKAQVRAPEVEQVLGRAAAQELGLDGALELEPARLVRELGRAGGLGQVRRVVLALGLAQARERHL